MESNKNYKIIITDDQQMFRNGLKLLIEVENIGTVIGEAENGQLFLELLEKQKPDLVLMDIDMPVMNGMEATEAAVEKYPDLKILALSMFGDEKYYAKMINAGVKGFVLKNAGKHDLEKAIREVAEGRNFFSTVLLQNIMANIDEHKNAKNTKTSQDFEFAEQELKVLQHLSNGLPFSEIAETLQTDIKTVESLHNKLLTKTNSNNTVTLIIFAIKHGLVKTQTN